MVYFSLIGTKLSDQQQNRREKGLFDLLIQFIIIKLSIPQNYYFKINNKSKYMLQWFLSFIDLKNQHHF